MSNILIIINLFNYQKIGIFDCNIEVKYIFCYNVTR